jgi:predicted dehydrogenase
VKVLIIGLGSIAKKHINALKELNANAELLALRSTPNTSEEKGVVNIYGWQDVPGDLSFILISNPTSEHYSTIKKCLNYKVPLFIEKPPMMSMDGVAELEKLIKYRDIKTYVAFNFRFHPLLVWLKENIAGKRVLEVNCYCGSYLPQWRPGVDYKQVYSAKKELGGGVHLDLIHEIDYVCWIFGYPLSVESKKSKISDLEIDVPDSAMYWLGYEAFNISIQLNYYRRDTKRQLEVVMQDNTWTLDLLTGTVFNSNKELIYSDDSPVLDTYLHQMRYFLNNREKGQEFMNDFSESTKALRICLAK